MNHIEKMARAMHDGPLGADEYNFDATDNTASKQYCEDMAQAAFDALIDAVPDLVWEGFGEQLSGTAFGVERFYTISGEPESWMLNQAGTRQYDSSPHKTQVLAKAAANTHHREQARKIWEGE